MFDKIQMILMIKSSISNNRISRFNKKIYWHINNSYCLLINLNLLRVADHVLAFLIQALFQ